MTDLNSLKEKVIKFQVDREWDKNREPKDDAIDVVVEASEILEHFQWKKGAVLEEYVKTHKDEISKELGDVLWGLLSLANQLDVDLEVAFAKMLEKNERHYPLHLAKGNNKKYTEFK